MATPNNELERTALNPGDLIPGYELLSSIGSGGFGVVFKARQLALDRLVALKLVRLDKEMTPELDVRFQSEARVLGKLHHPNIVEVYDYGHHNGRFFLAMELLEGEDLGQKLATNQPMDERLAWAIARQTAVALAHAAARGVIHRDVKPANLFLVAPPTGIGWPHGVPFVKVMDFGLALTKSSRGEEDVRLTRTNAAPGTPLYMAPEQYRKAADLDHRADVYALGATIFYALTGRPPFPGPTTWDLMLQKLEHKLRFDSNVSPESIELLSAMMTPEPKSRIGTYEELITRIALLPVMQEAEIRSGTRTNQAQGLSRRIAVGQYLRRRWSWLTAAGVLTTTGVALGYWGTRQPVVHAQSAPEEYDSNGTHESLFESRSIAAWVPPSAGGTWYVQRDEENLKVLEGTGYTRRFYSPIADYRITIGLDVHQAVAAEVHFAIPASAPEKSRRYVLRVTRSEGARFGIMDGDKGVFRTEGTPIPFPPESWFKGRRPYLEVKLERAGDRWRVCFHGKEAGQAIDDGTPKSPELRLAAEGGNIRVDSVSFTPLKKR